MQTKHFYVYILASGIGGTLYIGVTNDQLIEENNPNWDDLFTSLA